MTLSEFLQWFFSLPPVWGALLIIALFGVLGMLKKKR